MSNNKILPILDYVETEISEICNLNCRGCCDFINLCTEKKFYDLSEYSKDMHRLSELFSGINKIRIMGGEPLLNPHLTEYTAIAREIFPDSDIRIVTNGLLIPSLSNSVLKILKEQNIMFDISNYPPTEKKKKEIAEKLNGAGIKYDFSIPMKFFFRNILKYPSNNPAPAFNNCIFTHCHMLGHGKLAPCSYAYCIGRFNEKFGTSYPENDYFDIYSDVTGEQIIKAFSQPHEFCKCCGKGIIPIKWQGHISEKNAKPEDWLIEPTFINTTVAPALQSIVKPVAVKLRSKIQAKK